ncbi:Sensors of blue-light using FAD superfamily [Sulfitobacter noctilucicola]|nr:Sensors of blue-light using FAD superfamily [Sulfitobacter noctilucicola]
MYFSTAQSDISMADVDNIVALSAKKNGERNITGALAYNGRNFCQLLEGEHAVVKDLLNTIEEDARHTGFKVIDSKEITDRHFPDWSMMRVDGLDFSTVINAMNA